MFEDLFSRGHLELSQDIFPARVAESSAWWDVAANKVLTGIAVAVFLFNLSNFLSLAAPLRDCLFRVKTAKSIEHNIGLSRTRNITVICLILPFSLIISRYDIYHPAFFDSISPTLRTIISIGAVALFLILTLLISLMLGHHGLDNDLYFAACRSPFNYFIIAFSIMLISLAIFMPFGVPDTFTGKVILVEIIILWAFAVLRSYQILRSRCDYFTTILYLCALEIIPSAVIVASAMLF